MNYRPLFGRRRHLVNHLQEGLFVCGPPRDPAITAHTKSLATCGVCQASLHRAEDSIHRIRERSEKNLLQELVETISAEESEQAER